MSTNKMATKADLQEMYQRMLPYLGGMPEVLANKFSKGDMYSADEKMIGQWVDGKPLYQKNITKIISSTAGAWTNLESMSGVNVVSYKGYGTDGSQTYPLPYSSGTAYVSFRYESNTIQYITSDSNWLNNNTIYLTIQYTKTTDSPISIGNDTDYSTDEKIIGTWIDGKPLWQKTINTGALQGGQDNQILHGISNFDALINCFGIAYRGTNRTGVPIPHVSRTSLNWSLSCGDFAPTSFYIEVGTDYSGQYAIVDSYVTLQYTKTS